MTPFVTLLRRHLLEARWLLGFSALGFFLIAWLAAWRASDYLKLVETVTRSTRAYELRLVSASDPRELPATGTDLVVVAEVKGLLYFRVFDSLGKRVVDEDEGRLRGLATQVADFKNRLEPLRPPHELTAEERDAVTLGAASILGQALSRRYAFPRVLGGREMDYSTAALEVCYWNQPLVVITLLAWVLSRASAAVAGEIERGTIDITMSRPVSRPAYLTSQVVFTALGLVALACAFVAGTGVGNVVHALRAPPSLVMQLRPAASALALGMAVFGYTLPFSSVDVVRWRPAAISGGLTLAGLMSLSVASQFPSYEDLLKNLSVFQFYAPVTVAMKGDPLGRNLLVLGLLAAAGLGASYALFLRRDLPSNS